MMLFVLALVAAVPDTVVYPVLNHGRHAGDVTVARAGAAITVTYRHVDRNRGRWLVSRYELDASGAVRAAESRPTSRTGEPGQVAERFELARDSVRWTARNATGAVAAAPGWFFPLGNATAFDHALLARHLLRQPERRAPLLPRGVTARLEIAADTVVPTANGRVRVRLAMLHRTGDPVPTGVWIDDADELFASSAEWFVTVRAGGEPALPVLRGVELAYRARHAESLARRVAPEATGTVVIRNGDVFDAERGVMLPRTTVVIEGDRITAVGPAGHVREPRGARVVDAAGKQVVPGLWDMHTHFFVTSQNAAVVRQLAAGITTIRDLASDLDVAVGHRDRANAGIILSPRVLLAGFIEGPGAWAGPSEVLVRTEDEARAWVARYDSLGYRQIKVYNLLHPDLLPVIATESRRRGLRLSGHVPRGLSVRAAVELGMDEINHAAFLFADAYPDSLFVPEMRPYSGVAALVAPRVDVRGPAITSLASFLAHRRTVVDGTFNLWLRPVDGPDSADARRANENYLGLVRGLHEAGVVLVPGTDGSSYNDELENYERAGIPAPEVLRLATFGSATVMNEAADHGSIAPGKVADLLIVAGKPAERVADLRQVEWVFRAGKGYRTASLKAALEHPPEVP